MVGIDAIALSWSSFWSLRKHHAGPGWARLLIASGLALLAWAFLFLLGLAGVLSVDSRDPDFLARLLGGVLLLFLSIAWTVLALVRCTEWLLPRRQLARLSPVRDWRAAALVGLLLVAGIMAGNLVGSALLALLYPDSELFASSMLRRQLRFLQLLPVMVVVHGIVWRLRLQRLALQAQAAEAQLRLLHAQIEPHFLFNTLATIETLLEAEPARGRAMLEAFSDHLRSSLTQLRGPDTTLDAELTMATNYLRLLQIRMGARLAFSIEAGSQARAALMPPLLLQPLVENAIRHGIEPKVEGGSVRIVASVDEGWLKIRIHDDGIGSAAARVPSTGQGMALDNIRARLHHRHGHHASLQLDRSEAGACASIDLPYRRTP